MAHRVDFAAVPNFGRDRSEADIPRTHRQKLEPTGWKRDGCDLDVWRTSGPARPLLLIRPDLTFPYSRRSSISY
jgi:hypothetical protein